MTPLVLLHVGLSTALAPFTLVEPEVDDASFALPLDVPAQVVAQAVTTVSGPWAVVYLPRVQGSPAELEFPTGPVARLRVKPVAKGTVLLLQPARGSASALVGRLRLVGGSQPGLSVGAPARPTLLDYAFAPAEPAATLAPAPPREVATERAAPAAGSPAPPSQNPSGAVPPIVASAAVSSAAPIGLTAEPGASWRFVVLLLVAGAAAAAVWLARRRRTGVTGGGQSIDVVAVRPLGGKHRLVMVAAGGDRLLLASNDKEVRLLHVMGAADAAPIADAGDALATDGDLAGLIRLRQYATVDEPLRGDGGQAA